MYFVLFRNYWSKCIQTYRGRGLFVHLVDFVMFIPIVIEHVLRTPLIFGYPSICPFEKKKHLNIEYFGTNLHFWALFYHRYVWTGPYMYVASPLPFFFFWTSIFFSYKQHFATFYVSLYDIYTINTIKQ